MVAAACERTDLAGHAAHDAWVYRDPRWNSIVACADCRGTGLSGAHACGVCDGRGTLRLAPVDTEADAAVVR